MTNVDTEPSYRESHLTKGVDYEEAFRADLNPHRAMMWNLEKRVLDRILATRFQGAAPRHLDFACGTGRIIGHIGGERTASSTGIDVSASMLNSAKKNAPFAKLYEADITRNDPFGDQTFDLITAFRFFPNAEPSLRAEVIQALAKHLAPNGYLVFNNHKNATSLVRWVAKRLRGSVDPKQMTREEVYELVGNVGLQVVDYFPLGSLPFTERHMPKPAIAVELAERALSIIPATTRIAQNTLYVCAKI
jgi:predicted TPR repeat methyltransferase